MAALNDSTLGKEPTKSFTGERCLDEAYTADVSDGRWIDLLGETLRAMFVPL